MHDIGKYLKHLLVVENTVSLPGIGGFVKQYKEADVSRLKKNISPPLKTISFNKYLGDENDVLVKYIMDQEKITEPDARKKTEGFLTEIKKNLEENGQVMIDGVGELKKKASGEVVFESNIADEELADNFGLTLLEIDVPEKPGNSEKTEDSKPVNTNKKTKNTHQQRNTVVLVVAIAIVLLAPVVYFVIVKTDLFDRTTKTNLVDEVEKEVEQIEKEQQEYADSIDKVLEQKLNQLTQKGKALKPGMEADNYYDQFDRFYLVAGSFENYKFAEELKNNLINKGYSDADIVSSNGLYRVTITSYTDRKIALERLNELRRDYNSNVWVLSI
ncbi:MAG: hypothetical protein GVY19_07595 [Bacteroidetes bacterium]|jgi:nucleoid DNA-binding protein|nr:hypothetical protein [Bacteroidota bacterium]